MNISLYLTFLSIFLGVVPLFAIFLIKQKNTAFITLAFYLFYSLISDLFLSKLSIRYLNSELYSFRVFTFVEYFSIIYILTTQLESVLLKKIIKNISICFVFFLLFDFFNSPLNEFDSIPTGIESLLILGTSILLLYEKVIKTNNYFSSFVWISIGLILFFAGTFFLFILSQNNYSNLEFNITYGYIVAVFKILMYLFIFIGIITEIKTANVKTYTI